MKNHAIIYKKVYRQETVHANNLHTIRRLLKTICAMHRMEIYMKKNFIKVLQIISAFTTANGLTLQI